MDKKGTEEIRREEERIAWLNSQPTIGLEEYETEVRKWMIVDDPGILRLIPAAYVANIAAKDPVWMMVVGPSGGGKTELLSMLLDLPEIYSISLMTPATLLSGFPGHGDASLLPKVTGKLMIFKDWTSLLAMNRDALSEVMGQLREVYDGQLKKPFGNGRVAEWKGKVSILAGCTPAIDIAAQMHAHLGERFITYRPAMPDRLTVARRCLENGNRTDEMRDAIRAAAFRFVNGIDFKLAALGTPQEAKDGIVEIADLATRARSGVIRDQGSRREVIFVPGPEMPTRLVQQLSSLASALYALAGGRWEERDTQLLRKVAMDSIPQTNRMVMSELSKTTMITAADLAVRLGYPTAPIHMYLENLALLGIVRRSKGKDTDGTADRWDMLPSFAKIIRATGEHDTSYVPPATAEEVAMPESTINVPVGDPFS